MPAYNCLCIIAIGSLMMIGEGAFAYAEDSGAVSSSSNAVAPDGTPVVHKSLHKKKPSSASTSAASTSAVSNDIAVPTMDEATPSAAAKTVPATSPSASVPTVETGLPIARNSGLNGLGYSAPSGMQNPTTSYRSTIYSSLPQPSALPGATATAMYTPVDRSAVPTSNFTFSDFPRKSKNTYPWKTNIITTMFYIGEGGSSISPTDNKASSWDQEWVSSNHGNDNPYDRNGYASGNHASTINPFYIALPFNDLVYPDKAREWLPAGWHRPPKDGKPVSACKDRWVEIKTEDGSGHVCYAQWEDVGPLRYDHAEYVFGSERPDTYTRAGLDVSPAVAQYLGIDGERRSTTRWRFVDDEDVPPGAWLKYDEQAVIYEALHHKSSDLPIQRASEPIDDPLDIDANKKKVGAAKG